MSRRKQKEQAPLAERLIDKRPTVWRDAELELRARVIELLVAGGHVTWETVDRAYKLAKDLR